MMAPDWFLYVKEAGAYCAPLLLAGLIWMKSDRDDILAKLEAQSTKLESLSERTIVVMTELKGLLSGKASGG